MGFYDISVVASVAVSVPTTSVTAFKLHLVLTFMLQAMLDKTKLINFLHSTNMTLLKSCYTSIPMIPTVALNLL